MNWIKGQWVPVDIKCRGVVKDWDGDEAKPLITLKANVCSKEFIKTGKIKLNLNKTEVKSPV